MPKVPTCWPTPLRRTAATSFGARSFTTKTSIPTAPSAPTSSSRSSTDSSARTSLVQVKNGPIDFQPREPFHPLFGALKQTPVIAEIQPTQEYLGQAKHLVYLGTMWKEFLDSDTFAKGPGSTVGKVLEGTVHPQRADRHGRRAQSRPGRELVRASFLAGQLVRRSAGLPGITSYPPTRSPTSGFA